MSMAGSHSTRATRKEYDSTKSLYGIPEESGWSIPMPAIQAERARKNVMAVYYTCLDTAPADGAEISNTPDVEFTTEDQYGSYFDQRSVTAMSDSIRADGSMSELVLKLDSLDDFFDDRKPITTREASRGSIENRENVYEQQTLPILHKSLKRNASVTSFQNGFSDTRFALAREPVVMNPGAFASNPAAVVTRPALHARQCMMAAEVDDELQLMRASAGLLSDLQAALSKLLWKRGDKGRVHNLVRSRDLDHVIQLIEPFQGEPQLLDAHLKTLLPPIVEAYLAFLQVQQAKSPSGLTVSLDVAASKLLYTFCKVRGEKIIIGFLNNEPRYLELVLANLEDFRTLSTESDTAWEKSYVLLLWLTHLMLVPFDLSSISAVAQPPEVHEHMSLQPQVPSIARRIIALSIHYLASATREQDAAAKMLVRLVTRPDMQRLELPAALVSWALMKLLNPSASPSSNLHTFLGPLRFLTGMTVSVDTPEVASLMPSIYSVGQRLMDDAMLAFLSSSAVTKKLVVKLLRNMALLSLQCPFDGLIGFLEASNVLEETIDYCLQSLEDRDTPVRFAASKALSMIILRLDPEMGHEVIQAVLESFKEDMPKSSSKPDFGAANALRWHGLTLTLAHALFRRSASPQQLPEILNALLLALSFEQRSAVGIFKMLSLLVSFAQTQANEHPIRFIFIILLLLPLSYFVTNEFIRKNARIPGFNGPPGKPVFGNIPDIKYNASEKYREWSKMYGDVYQIQLGNIPVIVCNSAEACRVLFGHFSQALSSRPVFYTFHKVLSNTAGTTIGTSPFSDSLKRRRKGAASALNKPSVASYVGHLDVETLAFVKEGLEHGAAGTQSVDPMPMIQRLSLSLALTLNWGTRLGSRNDPLFHEITEVEEEISKFRSTSGNMQDYVPFLRLNPFNAGSTRAREMRQRRDVYLT
ncbi:cytochrome P450, partial [Aureobasidium melanogenum]